MATTIQTMVTSRGICSACKHEEDCIFPRDRAQIVLNCEQFEACPPVSRPIDKARMELEELWKRPSGDKPNNEFKGLCSNCEERYTCIYPKPAGGVWHCEEYR